MRTQAPDMAAAARRIPLEKPPSATDEARATRLRDALRARVGKNLRQARIAAGLSQIQLGVRANVSGNYVGQAELGRRGVTIDYLSRIAYHLSVDVTSFLSE
jgi:ribosome-binding protein aMBF1 (putative translation factor)